MQFSCSIYIYIERERGGGSIMEVTTEFSLWSWDSSSNSWMISASGDLVPTITGYVQALYSAYNAKRISMSGWRWNPFGMGRKGRGRLLGDRGSDVRGGTVDAGYEGRTRRSLKWKCHWRKVKVINGICPSYRVNSMSDAIVAVERDTRILWWTGPAHWWVFRTVSKGCETEECWRKAGKSERKKVVKIVQMKTRDVENDTKGAIGYGNRKWNLFNFNQQKSIINIHFGYE